MRFIHIIHNSDDEDDSGLKVVIYFIFITVCGKSSLCNGHCMFTFLLLRHKITQHTSQNSFYFLIKKDIGLQWGADNNKSLRVLSSSATAAAVFCDPSYHKCSSVSGISCEPISLCVSLSLLLSSSSSLSLFAVPLSSSALLGDALLPIAFPSSVSWV